MSYQSKNPDKIFNTKFFLNIYSKALKALAKAHYQEWAQNPVEHYVRPSSLTHNVAFQYPSCARFDYIVLAETDLISRLLSSLPTEDADFLIGRLEAVKSQHYHSAPALPPTPGDSMYEKKRKLRKTGDAKRAEREQRRQARSAWERCQRQHQRKR